MVSMWTRIIATGTHKRRWATKQSMPGLAFNTFVFWGCLEDKMWQAEGLSVPTDAIKNTMQSYSLILVQRNRGGQGIRKTLLLHLLPVGITHCHTCHADLPTFLSIQEWHKSVSSLNIPSCRALTCALLAFAEDEGEVGKVKTTSPEAPAPSTQHRASVLEKVSSALSRVFSRTSTSSKSAPAPD